MIVCPVVKYLSAINHPWKAMEHMRFPRGICLGDEMLTNTPSVSQAIALIL